MGGDGRCGRVAVVANALLPEALDRLEQEGWGAIQLPPAELDAETAAAWLEQVAEHVAEFERNGYTLVHLSDGVQDEALAHALRAAGAAPLADASDALPSRP